MNIFKTLIILVLLTTTSFFATACSCAFAPGDSTFFTSLQMRNPNFVFVLKGYKTHFVQGGVGFKVLDKVMAAGLIPDTIMIFGDLTGTSCASTPNGGIGDTTYILLSRRFMANGAPTYPQIDSGDFSAWLCEHNTLTYYQDSVYTIGPNFPLHQGIKLSEQQFIDSLLGMPLSNHNVQERGTDISIYPNPAYDRLYIKAEAAVKIEGISLYNTLGQQSKAVWYNGQLDVSHLPSGMYMVYVQTNKGILPKKIVISK